MAGLTTALRRLIGRVRPRSVAVEGLPDHESGVRRMMADADGGEYVAFASLEAARLVEGATVVMEGDYGGQIYLTCPVQLVNCDEARLLALLGELDGFGWKDPEGSRLYYERAPVGSGVGGGMGGGKVVDGVWLHDELRKLGLAERVQAVIGGETATIGGDSSLR